MYCLPFKICCDTISQTFQYKMNHRYISCNYNLCNWKKIESPACTYGPKVDTLEHYFFYLWESSKILALNIYLVKKYYPSRHQIYLLEVLLGILHTNPFSFVYNLIILQGKHYIYTFNKDGKDLNFPECLNKLKYYDRKTNIIK